MFEENLAVFFNPDEFAVSALIQGKTIDGLLTRGYEILSEDCKNHRILMCAASSIDFVTIRDQAMIEGQRYQIIGIQYDGTGLTKLILNALGKV